jgi:hypothetical protein
MRQPGSTVYEGIAMLARVTGAANAILPMTWDETKAAARFA